MNDSIPAGNNHIHKYPTLKLHIIGPNMLQNELLMSYLEEEMGAECRLYQDIGPGLNLTYATGCVDIILIDCQNSETINPWSTFNLHNSMEIQKVCLIFYNVSPGADIDQPALVFGARGIFYHGESFDMIPKGIKAVVNGELWFSRKTISKCLINNQNDGRIPTDQSGCLTLREKEILFHLATGSGNREIASILSISLHTVKTHIYNIFKKINVKNRFQASLWAAKYI